MKDNLTLAMILEAKAKLDAIGPFAVEIRANGMVFEAIRRLAEKKPYPFFSLTAIPVNLGHELIPGFYEIHFSDGTKETHSAW